MTQVKVPGWGCVCEILHPVPLHVTPSAILTWTDAVMLSPGRTVTCACPFKVTVSMLIRSVKEVCACDLVPQAVRSNLVRTSAGPGATSTLTTVPEAGAVTG